MDDSGVAMIIAAMETYLLLTRILTFVSHFVLSNGSFCLKNILTVLGHILSLCRHSLAHDTEASNDCEARKQ